MPNKRNGKNNTPPVGAVGAKPQEQKETGGVLFLPFLLLGIVFKGLIDCVKTGGVLLLRRRRQTAGAQGRKKGAAKKTAK
eukprot:596996-Rhodomonas_salina.4